MNRLEIQLRSLARKLGLTRFLRIFSSSTKYEERFSDGLLGSIRSNDVVWDVGANVGFYTEKFAKLVKPSGSVVAFEPSPASAKSIREKFGAEDGRHVEVVQMALADETGDAVFDLGDGEESVTNHLVTSSRLDDVNGTSKIKVEMTTADELVFNQGLKSPNVVKIDVEGFEWEVLRGMSRLLRERPPRAIFIEVHFSVLEGRGIPMAPLEIQKLLADAGFQVAWLDASHIVGYSRQEN